MQNEPTVNEVESDAAKDKDLVKALREKKEKSELLLAKLRHEQRGIIPRSLSMNVADEIGNGTFRRPALSRTSMHMYCMHIVFHIRSELCTEVAIHRSISSVLLHFVTMVVITTSEYSISLLARSLFDIIICFFDK